MAPDRGPVVSLCTQTSARLKDGLNFRASDDESTGVAGMREEKEFFHFPL